jgi:Tol biopolymer transport system component
VAGHAAGAGVALALRRPPEAAIVKAFVPTPEDSTFYLNPESPGPVALSPDGRRLAFSAQGPDGKVRLFVRNLDSASAHPLPGTENAGYPFWSPDSRWLGFFVRPDRILRKIDVTGGPPVTLCAAPNGKGATWSPTGTIVFAPDASGPLHRVPAAGGTSQPLTKVDTANHNSHRHPRFLPDGKRFLFHARGVAPDRSTILVGSLDDEGTREVVRATSQAEYASGQLLFVRERVLVAQPFDASGATLSGEAVPLAEDLLVISGAALSVFSTSANGALAYLTGKAEVATTLEWRDREGKVVGTLGEPAVQRAARLSPDGRLVAAQVADVSIGTHDLWIYEVDRGLRTRFTFDPGEDVFPTWAPDGKTLYFSSNAKGTPAVYRKAVEGAGEVELVHSSEDSLAPSSVSPDGRLLLVNRSSATAASRSDVMLLPVEPAGAPTPFRATEFAESVGAFSPDGKWVAWASNESGEYEVYVTPFPGPGRRWQVSPRGGVYPAWRRDGRELLWTQMDGMLASAEVSAEGDTFRVGPVKTLFRLTVPTPGGATFSLSPDGKRILVAPQAVQRAGSLLTLVLGWPKALETRR